MKRNNESVFYTKTWNVSTVASRNFHFAFWAEEILCCQTVLQYLSKRHETQFFFSVIYMEIIWFWLLFINFDVAIANTFWLTVFFRKWRSITLFPARFKAILVILLSYDYFSLNLGAFLQSLQRYVTSSHLAVNLKGNICGRTISRSRLIVRALIIARLWREGSIPLPGPLDITATYITYNWVPLGQW